MSFIADLGERFRRDPDTEMIEYQGQAISRGTMVGHADALVALIAQAAVPDDAFVAVVVRNRPLMAATLIGLITRERPMRTVYSFQSARAIADDVRGFAAIVAEREDWTPELIEAARAQGSAAILLDLDGDPAIGFLDGLDRAGPGEWHRCQGERALEMLSSGTTGKPKPIRFPYRLLTRAVESSAKGRSDTAGLAPDIFIWPFGGIGGVAALTADVYQGRHITLMDKFNVDQWVAAVKKRRPHYVSATTTILRSIYDANVAPEDISSIKHYWGGSMHLPADFQEAFEARYHADIIWALGATEFCGTILAWTPELKKRFGKLKRGAVGKPFGDAQVRVVDPQTGLPLPAGEVGYIEALVPSVSPEWMRSTDLAVVDEDGFFFHRGRGDGAIVRGGFKILPEKLVDALCLHPGVLDAAVVAADDDRLGQVPVAYVELTSDAGTVSEDELTAHMALHVAKTQMPVRIVVLDRLPRTGSLKVSLGSLRERAAGDVRPAL